MFWSPFGRESVVVSSLNDPALTFVLPDSSEALNGNEEPGQEPPPAPEVIANWPWEDTGSLPDHGANDAFVVYVPQCAGVASGARSPPKKCSSASSKGSCGWLANVERICPGARPVTPGSPPSSTEPGSLTRMPASLSSATRYCATCFENGFCGKPAKFCGDARYTKPSSG